MIEWKTETWTGRLKTPFNTTTTTSTYLCPDLLAYRHIGAADNWRGWVVRGFFWVMRLWRTK